MTGVDYTAPVSDLLTLGDCREIRVWPDYLAMGIGPEHIPDLIRMVEDDELNWDDWVGEEVPDVFGMIGSPAIPALTDYLMEPLHGLWARTAAAHGLAESGNESSRA